MGQSVPDIIYQARVNNALSLDLSGKNIVDFPRDLIELGELRELILRNNSLISIPLEVSQMTQLESLDISGNHLTHLPQGITELCKLRLLKFTNNLLDHLPPSIENLIELKTLELHGNKLRTLPPQIGKMIRLESIILDSNQLTSLPEEFGYLSSLQKADFDFNSLRKLPESFSRLLNLSILTCSRNQLEHFPIGICGLPSLRTIQLNNNQIRQLPREIGSLRELRVLHINNNAVERLPESIGNLENLEDLDVSQNLISTMDFDLSKMTKLERLLLSDNKLSSFPEAIIELSNLRALELSHNQITSVPEKISKLKMLETLGLRSNCLENIPAGMQELANLTSLSLDLNPFQVVDLRHLELPPQKLINYILNLQEDEKRKELSEAKVLIVGPPMTGKSDLMKSLVPSAQGGGDDSTKGVDVKTWRVQESGLDLRVNIWDFGGQDDLRATHRFFFTTNSLYILVLDARQGVRYQDICLWLDLVVDCGGDVPIIVTINKTDVRPVYIDQQTIRENYKSNAVEFIDVSAHDNTNIDKLRKMILDKLRQTAIIGQALPSSWHSVRNFMREINKPYISRSEFGEICQAAGIEDHLDQETMLDVLHRWGSLIYFDSHPVLKEKIIVKPEWLMRGVYSVLTKQESIEARGVLSSSLVYQILGDAGYLNDNARFIMEVMKHFELCYEDKDSTFYFPHLFSPDEPDKQKDGRKFDKAFRYLYSSSIESIIARFILRMYFSFQPDVVRCWRTGAEITCQQKASAIVRADEMNRTITVEFTGESTAQYELSSDIRLEFDRIHKSLKRGKPILQVQLPDGSFVDLEYAKRVADLGFRRFPFQQCTEVVDIISLLNGVGINIRDNLNVSGVVQGMAVSYSEASDFDYKLKSIRPIVHKLAQRNAKKLLWYQALIMAAIWGGCTGLIYWKGWDIMEKWTWIGGTGLLVLTYFFHAITMEEFSPSRIFEKIVTKEEEKYLKELGLDS